jgi:hypothetical protein
LRETSSASTFATIEPGIEVKTLLSGVGLSAGGWLGWVIGSAANVMAGYFMAVVCAAFGMYVARRWASRYY